jgi:hypothetical protein
VILRASGLYLVELIRKLSFVRLGLARGVSLIFQRRFDTACSCKLILL